MPPAPAPTVEPDKAPAARLRQKIMSSNDHCGRSACTGDEVAATLEAVLRQKSVCKQMVGKKDVISGRDEREVVAIERKLLAEADYGPVDFK